MLQLHESIEYSEVDNRLEKIDFVDLVKDAKSVVELQVFLLRANFGTDGMTSHLDMVWLPKLAVSNWRPPTSIFHNEFLQDSGHFRG